MAKSIEAFTWENGFQELSTGQPWQTHPDSHENGLVDDGTYRTPPSKEVLTSSKHNNLGLNCMRTWPTIYDGTNGPQHAIPSWWKPMDKVDVLICGAGPSGLQLAVSLARQGLTFRIVDKADTPLIAGRADGVQPRFLETLNCWGLAGEVQEEGPLIERTAIYKNGKKLLFGRSHQSDSRYRGLHIITQGQVERIYIRDLLRHKKLVERSTTVAGFQVDEDAANPYPVRVTLQNSRTGETGEVKAKYLIGADGASSTIRKSLAIPFDGVSTGIYWGIMDCVFESDYPHAWVFGSVVSSKHGGCVIIPRENGYIRLYTQLNSEMSKSLDENAQSASKKYKESGGNIDTSTITPEEVLLQANKIFAPYKLKFASPLSWFAVWKISERVARSFSSQDQRVHLVGDSAHVHSVMGAFGLNASIMDAANLAWKLGLCIRGEAKPEVILPTYSDERRSQALRIIRTSGLYLRFICNSDVPLAFNEIGNEVKKPNGCAADDIKVMPGSHTQDTIDDTADSEGRFQPASYSEAEIETDLTFLKAFFKANGPFLLGVDAAFNNNVLCPKQHPTQPRPITPRNGVRAPNPRVCISTGQTGYLYDMLTGVNRIHIVAFVSNIQGRVRSAFKDFLDVLRSSDGFYRRYGGASRFNIAIITKLLPFEFDDSLTGSEVGVIRNLGTVLYDDRAPDDDAHTCYGVDHSMGAVVVVRPDLWVGQSEFLSNASLLNTYFETFLQ